MFSEIWQLAVHAYFEAWSQRDVIRCLFVVEAIIVIVPTIRGAFRASEHIPSCSRKFFLIGRTGPRPSLKGRSQKWIFYLRQSDLQPIFFYVESLGTSAKQLHVPSQA